MEYLLSSTLVKPERYLSISSHSPASAFSSKCFILKKNPDSCSNLRQRKTQPWEAEEDNDGLRGVESTKTLGRTHLWTESLNFSSSKNCSMRNTSSLLSDVISAHQKFPGSRPEMSKCDYDARATGRKEEDERPVSRKSPGPSTAAPPRIHRRPIRRRGLRPIPGSATGFGIRWAPPGPGGLSFHGHRQRKRRRKLRDNNGRGGGEKSQSIDRSWQI